jgi:DNA-directed RNA polymerase specialized sigma subunit
MAAGANVELAEKIKKVIDKAKDPRAVTVQEIAEELEVSEEEEDQARRAGRGSRLDFGG